MTTFLKCFAVTVLIAVAASTNAQEKRDEELKAYYFVLLKKGPNRTQDSATAAKIQKEHLDNINRLASIGKLNVAGPFLDDGDMRGIFIFDSGNEQEVIALVESDPAIKAGRLSYEIHPWMTQKGICFK
ncbi:MAG: hypothetical protein KIS94_14730 [Chitinophagales bacterium]|nr:hypothetical protein [Chitinophagales bacterium]